MKDLMKKVKMNERKKKKKACGSIPVANKKSPGFLS